MTERILKIFKSDLKVINIGLEIFYRDLKRQNVDTLHVSWQPPLNIEEDLKKALRKLM